MIDLPDSPSPVSANPGLIDFGSILTPALGGPMQKVDRLGNRFKITVTMPPMSNPKMGRIWIARLIRGKSEGVRMEWPLQGFKPGTPGSILVNGASQSGRFLIADGATPGYVAREGQFFSIETNSQHFLYMVAEETIFNASGQATLPIEPMLRVSPANNDPCHFGKPMIEGLIMGDQFDWEMALANYIGLSFDLVEME